MFICINMLICVNLGKFIFSLHNLHVRMHVYISHIYMRHVFLYIILTEEGKQNLCPGQLLS